MIKYIRAIGFGKHRSAMCLYPGQQQMSASSFLSPGVWKETYSVGIQPHQLSDTQKNSLISRLSQDVSLSSTSQISVNGKYLPGQGPFVPTFASPIGGRRIQTGDIQFASANQIEHVNSLFAKPTVNHMFGDSDFHLIKETIIDFIDELKSSDTLIPEYLTVAATDFRAEKWNELDEFLTGTVRNMIAAAEITQKRLQYDSNLEIGATHFVSLANQNFPTILVFEAMLRHLLLGKQVMVIARPANSDTSHFPIYLIKKFQDYCIEKNKHVNGQALSDRIVILCVDENQRSDFLSNQLSKNHRAIVNVVGSAQTVQTIYADSKDRGYGVEVAGAGLTTMIVDGDNFSPEYIKKVAHLIEASKFVGGAKQCTALQDVALLYPPQYGISNRDLLIDELLRQVPSSDHQLSIIDAYESGGFKHNSVEMNVNATQDLHVIKNGAYTIIQTPPGGTPESETWGTNLIGLQQVNPGNALMKAHIRKHHLSLGLYLTNDDKNISLARNALQSLTGPTVISTFMAACFSQPPLGEGFRENAMQVKENLQTGCDEVTVLSEWTELVPFHTDHIVTKADPDMPIQIQPIIHQFQDFFGVKLKENELAHLVVFANELATFTQPPFVSNSGRSEVAVQYVYPDHDHLTLEIEPDDRLDALMKLTTVLVFGIDQRVPVSFRLSSELDSEHDSTLWQPFQEIIQHFEKSGAAIFFQTSQHDFNKGIYMRHQSTNPFKDGSRKTMVNVLNSIGFGPRQVKVSNTHYSQTHARRLLKSMFEGLSLTLDSKYVQF